MRKILGFVAGASLLLAATPALAASFTNVEFQNGDVTIQGTGGSTVSAKFRVVVGPGEVVEAIQTDVLGDNLAPVCEFVGGDKGLEEGTYAIERQIKLPPNTGTYTLAVQGSGVFGGFKTVDCTSNVVGSASFSGALKVVSGTSDTTSGSSSTGGLSQSILNAIATAVAEALKAAGITPSSGSTKPNWCSGLSTYSSLSYGDNSPLVSALQSFLIANGYATTITYGATGYFGPQTQAAYSSALQACSK